MADALAKIKAALNAGELPPVVYIASTEHPLLRPAARECIGLMEARHELDITRVDGPVPDMGEVIAAAGAISFFGTPRVVELREIAPGTMNEKDVDELAGLFGGIENSVLVVTAFYKDKKAAGTKKAKKLMDAAAKVGFAAELQKPTRGDDIRYVEACAAALDAVYDRGVADMLYDRMGADRALLQSETEKLAAVSGYGTISAALVMDMSAPSIEADVFELVRLIVAGRRADTFTKLGDLLFLRHEPIAIAAALAGSYIDMYRVRCGEAVRKNVGQVFKDMGYKGSDWRLKKARENGMRYSTPALERCVECLCELDIALKSSALPDKSILLEAAVGELLELGGRR